MNELAHLPVITLQKRLSPGFPRCRARTGSPQIPDVCLSSGPRVYKQGQKEIIPTF